MYQKPREAKRLYFDIIPRMADDYLTFREKYPQQAAREQLLNPVWHIHNGQPPAAERVQTAGSSGASTSLSFAMLLNLVAVANSEEAGVLWGFIRRYAPTASPSDHPDLDRLVGYALRYYRDFVRPAKKYRVPTEQEAQALRDLLTILKPHQGSTDGEALQALVYEVGRTHFPDTSGKAKSPDGRPGVSQQWFSTLYQILLGAERGPRFGSFIALFGVEETCALIEQGLDGRLIQQHEAFLQSRG